MTNKKDDHIDVYGDHEVTEYTDKPIPTFLKWVYVLLPIWGIVWFFLYWNGSHGILDRGHWQDLEQAANTRAPYEKVTADTLRIRQIDK